MLYTIIGIDESSQLLAAVVTRGYEHEVVTEKLPRDFNDRLVAAYKWMRWVVRNSPKPVAVFIEKPFAGKFAGSGLVLAGIHAVLVAAAGVAGADYVTSVPPATWKARVVGTGQASKGRVSFHVRKHWPGLYVDAEGVQDVYDAACINRYGAEVMRIAGKTRHIEVRNRRTLQRKPSAGRKTNAGR